MSKTDKVVETYKFKKEFEDFETFRKAYLKDMKSRWNKDDWKHWYSYPSNRERVKKDIKDYFYNRDAWFFALHEMTEEEFEKFQNTPIEQLGKNLINIKIEKIEDIEKHFRIYSHVVPFVDFEVDKYDYYAITEETKRTCSWHTVRILRGC